MDLDTLRTFVLAVQLRSLTAAARAVARSQPAVSLQIQRLEREAGDRLLVRQARGVRPTPAGEILYARAQGILRATDELLAELRASGALERGSLRIGATDVMAITFLPRVLARFRERYPGIRTAVEVEGSRGLARRVANGELDLALVTLPIEQAELQVREVDREPMRFVAAPDHPLTRRRVTLAQLAAEPMIQHQGASVTRQEVSAVFRVHGLEPRVAMEVSSPEAIKELVALGLGIAPLSRSQIARECAQGKLVALRAPDFRCWRRSGVATRADLMPRRVVRAFLEGLPGGRSAANGQGNPRDSAKG